MKTYYIYGLYSSDEPDRIRYIGVTSTSIKNRFYQHMYDSKNICTQPVHKWMKSKSDKGIEINHIQIEECDETNWQEKEIYWIDYYKKLDSCFLNLQLGGSGVVNDTMRNINGKIRSITAHKKPIAALDDSDNIMYKFDCIKDATEFFKLKSKSTISNALHGRTKKAIGYKWIFIDKPIELEPEKRNSNYNLRIIVNKFDLSGKLIKTYQSVRQLIREELNNPNSSGDHFTKNILNKNKIWKDHLWSTEETIEIIPEKLYKVCEYDIEDNFVRGFLSINECARYYNVDSSTINRWCKNSFITKNKTVLVRY